MPKDDKTTTTQTTTTTTEQPVVTTPPVPSIPMAEDVAPPMIPDIQTSTTTVTTSQPVSDTGSAAPANDVVMPTTPIASTPKKKFAGGRVIATILGLLLLVGGVGTGVYLVGQNQNPNEQAGSEDECTTSADCPSGSRCALSGGNKVCQVIPVTQPADQCGNGRCQSGENNNNCPEDCDKDTDKPTCNSNQFVCSNQCLSKTNSDNKNCGSCNHVCPSGSQCTNGVCAGINSLECTTTANCNSGQACINNTCKIITPNGDSDTQCNATTQGVAASIGVCCVPSGGTSYNDGTGNNPNNTAVGSPWVGTHWTTCATGYTCSQGEGCFQTGGGGGGSNPTPTPPAITAQCQNIKAYSETWVLLTDAQLKTLKPTNKVNFCVTGTATGGSFNKARFTVNNTLQAETTTVRPSSTDFCQLYTIQAGVNSYNVTAQINHVTLGWK